MPVFLYEEVFKMQLKNAFCNDPMASEGLESKQKGEERVGVLNTTNS